MAGRGGRGVLSREIEEMQASGGHFFPRLEGAREWLANQGDNSSHKVTLENK